MEEITLKYMYKSTMMMMMMMVLRATIVLLRGCSSRRREEKEEKEKEEKEKEEKEKEKEEEEEEEEEWSGLEEALARSQKEDELQSALRDAAQERRLSALAQVPGLDTSFGAGDTGWGSPAAPGPGSSATSGTDQGSATGALAGHSLQQQWRQRDDAVLLAPLLRQLFPTSIPDPAQTYVAPNEDDLDLLAVSHPE